VQPVNNVGQPAVVAEPAKTSARAEAKPAFADQKQAADKADKPAKASTDHKVEIDVSGAMAKAMTGHNKDKVSDEFANYFWSVRALVDEPQRSHSRRYLGNSIRGKFEEVEKKQAKDGARSTEITKSLAFEGFLPDATVDKTTQQLCLKSWKLILAGETPVLAKRPKGSSPIAIFYEVRASLLFLWLSEVSCAMCFHRHSMRRYSNSVRICWTFTGKLIFQIRSRRLISTVFSMQHRRHSASLAVAAAHSCHSALTGETLLCCMAAACVAGALHLTSALFSSTGWRHGRFKARARSPRIDCRCEDSTGQRH
jgi:hypothetical protein